MRKLRLSMMLFSVMLLITASLLFMKYIRDSEVVVGDNYFAEKNIVTQTKIIGSTMVVIFGPTPTEVVIYPTSVSYTYPAKNNTPVVVKKNVYPTATVDNFCIVHQCVSTFWKDTSGSIVQCADGKWTHSGGIRGACSKDGGLISIVKSTTADLQSQTPVATVPPTLQSTVTETATQIIPTATPDQLPATDTPTDTLPTATQIPTVQIATSMPTEKIQSPTANAIQ